MISVPQYDTFVVANKKFIDFCRIGDSSVKAPLLHYSMYFGEIEVFIGYCPPFSEDGKPLITGFGRSISTRTDSPSTKPILLVEMYIGGLLTKSMVMSWDSYVNCSFKDFQIM